MSGWIIAMVVGCFVLGTNMLVAIIGMTHQRREHQPVQASNLELWREIQQMKDREERQTDLDKQNKQAYIVRNIEGRKFRV